MAEEVPSQSRSSEPLYAYFMADLGETKRSLSSVSDVSENSADLRQEYVKLHDKEELSDAAAECEGLRVGEDYRQFSDSVLEQSTTMKHRGVPYVTDATWIIMNGKMNIAWAESTVFLSLINSVAEF